MASGVATCQMGVYYYFFVELIIVSKHENRLWQHPDFIWEIECIIRTYKVSLTTLLTLGAELIDVVGITEASPEAPLN